MKVELISAKPSCAKTRGTECFEAIRDVDSIKWHQWSSELWVIIELHSCLHHDDFESREE